MPWLKSMQSTASFRFKDLDPSFKNRVNNVRDQLDNETKTKKEIMSCCVTYDLAVTAGIS